MNICEECGKEFEHEKSTAMNDLDYCCRECEFHAEGDEDD